MTDYKTLIDFTFSWTKIKDVMMTDVITFQQRNYDSYKNYITTCRMVFHSPGNYTSIDDFPDLKYNDQHSFENMIAKIHSNKHIFGKLPKAIYVCVPMVAEKEKAIINGFMLFSCYELTSHTMFYGFNGLKVIAMPHITKNMKMPLMINELKYVLSYFMASN